MTREEEDSSKFTRFWDSGGEEKHPINTGRDSPRRGSLFRPLNRILQETNPRLATYRRAREYHQIVRIVSFDCFSLNISQRFAIVTQKEFL